MPDVRRTDGGQEKECIDADQWTISVQDEGEWRKTAKRIAAVACPNVTGRTKGGDSPKQACSYWFARHSYSPQVARIRITQALFRLLLAIALPFSGVRFLVISVLFCFVFVFLLSSLNPPLFVQSFFDMYASRQLHALINTWWLTTVHVLFTFLYFLYLWRCRFSLVLCTIHCRFLLHGDYLVHFPSGWCFLLPCDHGLDSDINLCMVWSHV